MTILTFAWDNLDQCARDCARAGANQETSANALSAINSQLIGFHKTDGVFIKTPFLVSTSSPNYVYQNYYGATPPLVGPGSPYITVNIGEKVLLPLSFNFFGVSLSQYTDNQGYFTLYRTYTYPIIKCQYFAY